jgi:peptidoglycan/LPS O-acetylase OafA/YrhL
MVFARSGRSERRAIDRVKTSEGYAAKRPTVRCVAVKAEVGQVADEVVGIDGRVTVIPVIPWAAAMACMAAAWLTADAALQQYWLALSFFVVGAHLARWSPRSAWLEAAPAQSLGKISYSLHLSHWLLFALARQWLGPIGALAALPLAFPVGWLVWATIERPSVATSRWVKSELWRRSVARRAELKVRPTP